MGRECRIEHTTPNKRRKQKKPSMLKKLLITIAAALVVLFVIIMFSENKKEEDAAIIESSAPAAESTKEYDVVVKPDGSFKAVDENADKIGLFVVEHLKHALDESFGSDYIITEYTNDVVVAIWSGIIAEDIDGVRAGNKECLSAWETCRDQFMEASKNMTFALQGYAPGSHVAIALVDPRNHEDVLLVVSDGSLMYDFDLDGDMDPWLIYSNYNEEVKNRKPNL